MVLEGLRLLGTSWPCVQEAENMYMKHGWVRYSPEYVKLLQFRNVVKQALYVENAVGNIFL